ncbi:aldo/keto reductase [Jannaschia seohaensis]|uniref:Predicted oxidoreductase n=1 Tax=Jannaschia seohaensis TaxID=475081 RepID=A0A2Y9B343_9RHOB|nr:aldo/keto reductase [Jannaschia seohaensis]PWJ16542.1 aryl-alcohol dehydrogenase-like predicted oxidoreductase [Jannaschia seohaensis]SSA48779.1 Predicted oxidoreductase [Jannaschia seohaensis]
MTPDRTTLPGGLEISRILTGLWQIADMERSAPLDPEAGADALAAYAEAGFDTFDMADHYGSAEIVAGRLLARGVPARAFTKWCPPPGPMTPEVVRAGVQERLNRLGVSRVDLLQFHWWSFSHPAWLDALHEMAALRAEGQIGEIGVTNFDAAHLRLAAADGVPLVSNQVSFSLIDRRAAGPLAEVCAAHDIKLLAYGTLCGGFLSERWLNAPEPSPEDWSKMKYLRFIQAAGGWDAFQGVLRAADAIARRHGVSIANVATRWVLEQTHVAGVIVGARLGESEHRADNARLFSFALDAEDHARLDAAFAATTPIPGDCGDEYRRPPFLTASGDLSHHLDALPPAHPPQPVPHRPGAERVSTGTAWEDIAGYARAQRIGDRILVSGTTATAGVGRAVAVGDAGAQTTFILDRIIGAVEALGGAASDIVRTRIYVAEGADVEAISRAHGRAVGEWRPVNTLVTAPPIGEHLVEIEAEAIVAG